MKVYVLYLCYYGGERTMIDIYTSREGAEATIARRKKINIFHEYWIEEVTPVT